MKFFKKGVDYGKQMLVAENLCRMKRIIPNRKGFYLFNIDETRFAGQ